jgi:hypothetical protein
MAWCAANRVDFLFCLARSERLEQAINAELMLAAWTAPVPVDRHVGSRTSCGRRWTLIPSEVRFQQLRWRRPSGAPRFVQRMLDPGSFPCSSRHRSKLSPLFRDREKAQLPQPFASQAWGFASETFRHIALRTPI